MRTEIITETTREIFFRLERQASSSFNAQDCGQCSAKLLTLNEAVQVSGLGWEEIISLMKTNVIHFSETANGEVFICVQSLFDFKNKEKIL